MGTLSEFINNASNEYHDISRGQILEKPYYKTKRFAENYSSSAKSKSPYSYWNVGQNTTEMYRNYLAESSLRSPLSTFAQKEIVEEKFKPIYGSEFKKLLWDMYINDYIAGEAVDIKSYSAFANQLQPTLMPIGNKNYESEDELRTALDDTGYSEKERKNIIDYINIVNINTGMEWYQQFLASQYMVGGVAALFVETFTKPLEIPVGKDENKGKIEIPIGTPALIKPLHWSYLDQVRVNVKDWSFKEVRYTDFENFATNTPVFVPARNLIYITRNDKMVTPNNLFYGLSDYHSILKLSNIIRQAEEVDFPEIVTSFWSQSGVFKFKNMNVDEMDKFMASVGPGLIRGFNSQIDFLPVNLKHDGWFLITLLQTVISHMLMKLRMPEFIYAGGGKNTSRSDVEIQMNFYRDIVLAKERWNMDHFLNDQWYSELISLATKETDPRKRKFRVVQNYIPLSFEDILAKANSLELLVRRYFIDIHEGRQILGLKPFNKNIDEKVNAIGQLLDLSPVEKINLKNQEKRFKEQQQAFQNNNQQQQQQPKNPNAKPLPSGQRGFQPPSDRANSKRTGTSGAGRGNKT